MTGRKAEYIVYDKTTDLPVCLGSAEECASFIGFTLNSFRTMVTKTKAGQTNLYEIYNIDELLKDYDEEKIFGK